MRFTSTVNDILTVGSLGLHLFNPPLGAVALVTTNIAGTGLGLTDAAMTKDPVKGLLTAGSAVVSLGAARVAVRAGGMQAARFNFGSMRYHSAASGRFITNAAGRGAYQLGGAAGSAATIPFMLMNDEEQQP